MAENLRLIGHASERPRRRDSRQARTGAPHLRLLAFRFFAAASRSRCRSSSLRACSARSSSSSFPRPAPSPSCPSPPAAPPPKPPPKPPAPDARTWRVALSSLSAWWASRRSMGPSRSRWERSWTSLRARDAAAGRDISNSHNDSSLIQHAARREGGRDPAQLLAPLTRPRRRPGSGAATEPPRNAASSAQHSPTCGPCSFDPFAHPPPPKQQGSLFPHHHPASSTSIRDVGASRPAAPGAPTSL
jgi:hypothetical protein